MVCAVTNRAYLGYSVVMACAVTNRAYLGYSVAQQIMSYYSDES